jgi:hypothetical protein
MRFELTAMDQKPSTCIVSCSVLKRELLKLNAEGKLDAELVFVSKNFHIDYGLLETNLRRMLEHTKKRFAGKIVLVYGDLCLGPDGEMKKLAAEYGVVKVDAVNCVDCQLGGKGAVNTADPDHNLMFMGPGMIDFFEDMKPRLMQQGVDEEAFANMFNGIKGFVVLDTCGDGEKLSEKLRTAGLNTRVLETRKVGTDGVHCVVKDAIEHA